jgi:hypothetical protein
MGLRLVGVDLLARGEKVRHSPQAAAHVAVALAEESRINRERRVRVVGGA